jgi:hypothetical protein
MTVLEDGLAAADLARRFPDDAADMVIEACAGATT